MTTTLAIFIRAYCLFLQKNAFKNSSTYDTHPLLKNITWVLTAYRVVQINPFFYTLLSRCSWNSKLLLFRAALCCWPVQLLADNPYFTPHFTPAVFLLTDDEQDNFYFQRKNMYLQPKIFSPKFSSSTSSADKKVCASMKKSQVAEGTLL